MKYVKSNAFEHQHNPIIWLESDIDPEDKNGKEPKEKYLILVCLWKNKQTGFSLQNLHEFGKNNAKKLNDKIKTYKLTSKCSYKEPREIQEEFQKFFKDPLPNFPCKTIVMEGVDAKACTTLSFTQLTLEEVKGLDIATQPATPKVNLPSSSVLVVAPRPPMQLTKSSTVQFTGLGVTWTRMLDGQLKFESENSKKIQEIINTIFSQLELCQKENCRVEYYRMLEQSSATSVVCSEMMLQELFETDKPKLHHANPSPSYNDIAKHFNSQSILPSAPAHAPHNLVWLYYQKMDSSNLYWHISPPSRPGYVYTIKDQNSINSISGKIFDSIMQTFSPEESQNHIIELTESIKPYSFGNQIDNPFILECKYSLLFKLYGLPEVIRIDNNVPTNNNPLTHHSSVSSKKPPSLEDIKQSVLPTLLAPIKKLLSNEELIDFLTELRILDNPEITTESLITKLQSKARPSQTTNNLIQVSNRAIMGLRQLMRGNTSKINPQLASEEVALETFSFIQNEINILKNKLQQGKTKTIVNIERIDSNLKRKMSAPLPVYSDIFKKTKPIPFILTKQNNSEIPLNFSETTENTHSHATPENETENPEASEEFFKSVFLAE